MAAATSRENALVKYLEPWGGSGDGSDGSVEPP